MSRERKSVSSKKFGLGGVMGDKENGFVRRKSAHRLHGGAAVFPVKSLERLIEHQKVMLRAEGTRKSAPPPHPAGKVCGGDTETVAKPEPYEQPPRFRLLFPSGSEKNVAERRKLRAEPVLLKYGGAALRHTGDRPCVRCFQTENKAEKRGFPSAGNAHDDARLPDGKPCGKIAENARFAVAFGEVFNYNGIFHHTVCSRASKIFRRTRRNTRSNTALTATITTVHAKRSAISRYALAS